jgi:hypothetical protein
VDETIQHAAEAEAAAAGQETLSVFARLLEVVTRIRGVVEKTVADATDATMKAENKAEELFDETVDIIEREPVITAALAFGIGCIAGYLIFARRNTEVSTRIPRYLRGRVPGL